MELKFIQNEIFKIVRSSGVNDSDFIVSDDRLSSQERLSAYRRSSFLKPYSCLCDDYQVTRKLVGEDPFDLFLEAYLKKYPADTHFINECGQFFPKFLIELKEHKLEPYICDLARLEWLRVESFYDFFNYKKPIEIKGQIHHNPSLRVIESEWPLQSIWHEETFFEKEATTVFIWTTEDRKVHVASWGLEGGKILKILSQSTSLEHAIDELLKDFTSEKLTKILTASLPEWVRLGLFEVREPLT